MDQAVGKHVDVVSTHLSDETTLLVQDVSPRVGEDASYKGDDSGADWTIVASCGDAATVDSSSVVEIAVIRSTAYSGEVEKDVNGGKFNLAVSCDGRNYR